jgi:DeoR/GlpR family transcriptional regulator of sugar metabolism
MGPGSALAKVIAEAEKRREAGEQVEFFRDGQTIILECVPTTQH